MSHSRQDMVHFLHQSLDLWVADVFAGTSEDRSIGKLSVEKGMDLLSKLISSIRVAKESGFKPSSHGVEPGKVGRTWDALGELALENLRNATDKERWVELHKGLLPFFQPPTKEEIRKILDSEAIESQAGRDIL